MKDEFHKQMDAEDEAHFERVSRLRMEMRFLQERLTFEEVKHQKILQTRHARLVVIWQAEANARNAQVKP